MRMLKELYNAFKAENDILEIKQVNFQLSTIREGVCTTHWKYLLKVTRIY